MSFALDYKDKVVLVTGVSSGIGLGVAKEFARAGAHVAGCSRKSPDDASVQAFREVVEQEGVRSFYRPADVTDAEELKGFVEDTVRTFGRIDMVVSNAGMNVFEGAEGCTEERWHYNLDLNLASHWRLAKLCKPHLEKSGEGVLLLMTSNHAFSSIPGCFPYNETKTAITGLVRSLAVHSPQGNIRLALNISQSRATQIARSVACYQGAGLQHAAFACRHLPETLDALPQVSRQALPIPANYYDDLLARYGEAVDVATLQSLHILYDRDPRGGEFLHLYTRPFSAGRFFFELTERRDGYALYGAANAAVRLSAMQYS